MNRITFIRNVIAVASVGLLLWSCSSKHQNNDSREEKRQNVGSWKGFQAVEEGYQGRFDYKGDLEKKYALNGAYAVDTLTVPSTEERIKLWQFYFPSELRNGSANWNEPMQIKKQWPVVIMANGTGILASKYRAIFRHLASWGFIVAGNEDEWTWDGRSVDMTLDYLLHANNDAKHLFYQRIDTAHIGLTGHSQGGMAVFTAATLFDNSPRYKALCPLSATGKLLGDSLGWSFLAKVRVPMLMVGGCGISDDKLLCPLEHMMQTYDSILNAPVIMGRIKDIDHGDVLSRGDAYMTAWMRYWLCSDQEAGECFFGDSAEMLLNKAWQDVKWKGLLR